MLNDAMQVTESCCPVCSKKFLAASLIPINGTAEQVKVLTEALATRGQTGHTKGKRKRENTS